MDYIGQRTTHIFTFTGVLTDGPSWGDSQPVGFAAQAGSYTTNMVPVIDFITLFVDGSGSAARAKVQLQLSDSNVAFWTGGLTIEAGDTDTLHVTFPTGLPSRAKSEDSSQSTFPAFAVTGTSDGTGYLSIGYHYELPSTRR